MCDNARELVLVIKNRCKAIKSLHSACVGLQGHAICVESTLDYGKPSLNSSLNAILAIAQNMFQENPSRYYIGN